jgi:hypothetical protein
VPVEYLAEDGHEPLRLLGLLRGRRLTRCKDAIDGQSHIDQLTVIRPGPHSCPLWQRSG